MKIALGTAQFGLIYGVANKMGAMPFNEIDSILNAARSFGIDTIDTAVQYGNSESLIGESGSFGFKVVTKVADIPGDCRCVDTWLTEQIVGSLKRLQADRLHAVLLHRPAALLEPRGSDFYRALKSIKEAGLTSKIGVSVYNPEELTPLFERFDFDIVQAPLNILDARLVSSGWADRLVKMGIEIHARSVFLQGLLLMSPSDRPAKFDLWSDVWREWDSWLMETGQTALEACVSFANGQPLIDRLIVGVDSAKHLDEIINAANAPCLNLNPQFRVVDQRLITPSTWATI